MVLCAPFCKTVPTHPNVCKAADVGVICILYNRVLLRSESADICLVAGIMNYIIKPQ